MKLYIPEIGDSLLLSKDWTFDLFQEYRNEALFKVLELNYSNGYYKEDPKPESVTIEKGATLKIDRIYIRKGAQDFSSITFYLTSDKFKKKVRFWAKLKDVNNIEFEEVKEKIQKPRVEFTILDRDVPFHDLIFDDINNPTGRKINPLTQKLPKFGGYVNRTQQYAWWGKNPPDIKIEIEYKYEKLKDEDLVYHDNQWPFRGLKKMVIKPVPRLTHEITFYNVKVFHADTGEFIGQAKTPATLKKKIQEYYMSI